MPLTTCSVTTSVIARLDNRRTGVTTDQFKAKFDEAATGLKDFFTTRQSRKLISISVTASETEAERSLPQPQKHHGHGHKTVTPRRLKVDVIKNLLIARGTMTVH
jgi:hypothetical protein